MTLKVSTAHNSLFKRLLSIALPITLLVGFLYAGLIAVIETQTLKNRQQDQVINNIAQLAKVIAIPTWNLDQQFISSYLEQYALDPYIECIELLSDANLKEYAPKGCTHPKSNASLHSEAILYEGQYIGVVVASYTIELDKDRLLFILLSRIPIAFVALLSIFIVFFSVFRRRVMVPIESMIRSLEEFQKTNIHQPVDWDSQDEIGTLVTTFNRTQAQQAIHDEMLLSAKEKAERAFQELQNTQEQLVESEKMASLGSLVAGISHEINTPLGVARTSASHVEDALKQVQEQFESGAITKQDLDDFLHLANDGIKLMTVNLMRASELMTSFKQVSSDQSHDEIRTFNLYEYLQETLYTLKPNLKKYRVAVLLDCDQHLTITSYPGAIAQIMTNLIMNSLIHAYELEDHGEIRIEVSLKEDSIQIHYQDNGKGMSADVQQRIFDPFFTTRRGEGGTGLGMHIIYNLVNHKLKGRIKVSSEVGRGTHFDIVIPKTLASQG